MKNYKRNVRMLRLVLSFILIFTISHLSYGQSNNSCKHLNAEEFYVKMHEVGEHMILDVRLAADYRESRIPGAVLAEEPEILKQAVDTLSKDTPVFVYCYDGDRSKTACNILTDRLQFYFVYNLKQGFEMWQRMKLPVDTAQYHQ